MLAVLALGGCADPCLRGSDLVTTVGEEVHLRVDNTDFVGDCRPFGPEVTGFTWSASPPHTSLPWEAPGPRVAVGPGGTLRALAPGPFSLTARKGKVVLRRDGVVLPAGWTMKLLPEDATITVGDVVSYRLWIVDGIGRRLPGLTFSVFPELEPQILRGPGLVSSTVSVGYWALMPGRTRVTAFLGRHSVETSLTVVGKPLVDTPTGRAR